MTTAGTHPSDARRFWRELRRSPTGMTGAVLLAIFLLTALFAPWLAPRDPVKTDLKARLAPQMLSCRFGYILSSICRDERIHSC